MYGQQFSTDEAPPEEIPEESQSPGGYPPSSGLPPDAMAMLSGMQPGMMGGQGGGMAGGGMSPGSDQMSSYQTSQGGLPPGGAQMAGMDQMDPMMVIKQQFDGTVQQLQMLAMAFPMATPELQEAGEAIARAMLKVAQGVQPDPMRPPMPA